MHFIYCLLHFYYNVILTGEKKSIIIKDIIINILCSKILTNIFIYKSINIQFYIKCMHNCLSNTSLDVISVRFKEK